MSYALVTAIVRNPALKTSKAEKTYYAADGFESLGAGAAARKWKIITFSEARGAELLAVKDGEAVALTGKFDVKPYEWNGETRLDFTLFVETIAPLRPSPKRKKEPSAAAPALLLEQRAPDRGGFKSRCGEPSRGLDDDIPF